MNWIKMNVSLATSPKVVIIASSLNDDRLKVVGALHAVWSVFDAHTEDGTLRGYTPDVLDSIIGWRGFSKAMISVGWLIVGINNSLTIKDYDEHNGKSAKRRAQNVVTQRRLREGDKKMTDECNLSSLEDDKLLTREEKIRIYTPIVPKGTNLEDASEPSDLTIGEVSRTITSDPALQRARMLFRMRDSTPLDRSQDLAWKKNRAAVSATEESDWLVLEWFYAQGTAKGEPAEYRRRDLSQLLNNWNGEIQRARAEAKKKGSNFLKKENGAEVPPQNWRELLMRLYPDSFPDGLQSGNFPGSFRFLERSVQEQIRTASSEEGQP